MAATTFAFIIILIAIFLFLHAALLISVVGMIDGVSTKRLGLLFPSFIAFLLSLGGCIFFDATVVAPLWNFVR